MSIRMSAHMSLRMSLHMSTHMSIHTDPVNETTLSDGASVADYQPGGTAVTVNVYWHVFRHEYRHAAPVWLTSSFVAL